MARRIVVGHRSRGRIACALALVLAGAATGTPARQDVGPKPMGRYLITVVDEDGEPLEGVEVWLDGLAEDRWAGLWQPPATTNARGMAGLQVPADIERRAAIGPDGTAMERVKIELPAVAEGQTLRREITLRTRDDAVFHGRLLDAATGEPLQGVEVHSTLTDRHLRRIRPGDDGRELVVGAEPTTRSDRGGRFEVPVSTWRERELTFRAPGRAWRRVSVGGAPDFLGADSAVDIELERGARLQLLVVDSPGKLSLRARFTSRVLYPERGDHDARHMHRLWIEATRFPGEDVFGLDRLPPGATVEIVTRHAGRIVSTRSRVEVPGADEESLVVIDLSPRRRIDVMLRGKDGPPPPQEIWVVRATESNAGPFDPHGGVRVKGMTDVMGRVSFADLDAARYRVGLAPSRVRGWKEPLAALSATVDVGKEPTAALAVLDVEPALYITGRVVRDGDAPMQTRVDLRRPDSPGWHLSAETDRVTGAFSIGPLVRGEYIATTKPSLVRWLAPAAPVAARAGDEGILLRMRRQVALKGVVDRPGATVLARNTETGEEWDSACDIQGRFRFSKLPAGRYAVSATSEERRTAEPVEVDMTDGDTFQVDLVLDQDR